MRVAPYFGVRKIEGFDICLRLYLNRKRLQKLRTYIFKFDQFDMISNVAPCLTMCENTDGVYFKMLSYLPESEYKVSNY